MTSFYIQTAAKIVISLAPVFLFLLSLVLIDSFKLVRYRSIFLTIFFGIIAGFICLIINSALLKYVINDYSIYTRYFSPNIEEFVKAIVIIRLIKSNNIGFLVDAAIYGFAIGTGFAWIENIIKIQNQPELTMSVLIIRGFGPALMHGGTTAIFAVISKSLFESLQNKRFYSYLPGLASAIALHSIYNHFFFDPLSTTVIILIALPLIFILIFNQSEKVTRSWLGVGFDTDQELLNLILDGQITKTKIGKYLFSLKSKFPGEIIVDMLCLLRIHLELSIKAKGILLLRDAGFKTEIDPETKEKFKELKFLEKSISKTGKLAISPILHTSSRDLWELHMLEE